ncbi:hypothetical protein JWJ88_03500 [Paracoccus methylovorus]|uniref:Uncharacterized protein n=1 Tax=Paracoccus methylovorus TaxID=2812658 RepID=A0ABX7JHN4_9RHOB|nr:hypothetical protein [Paracoccus methylovorus]QRZ13742.1 hypothetical protein JWJ88_03500 [Paracoccus methylovorus]
MTAIELDNIHRALELIDSQVALEVAQFGRRGFGLPILPLEIAARDIRRVLNANYRRGGAA